ncbi:organic radical activating enzyme [Opitutaceae bacterium TAV1]|nr:organic radical activating enzyme [Opitutaceae bacterium TAV1]
MSASTTLPVYETFFTWQGEGCHMGRAAFFIRTFGCPVKCAWCDSAGTWHPDWVPADVPRIAVDELAAHARATAAVFAVVTGGEPTIHDLRPLTAALRAAGLPAHLETSGAYPVRGDFAWITVSPKWARPPLPENLRRASELKLIVEDADSIRRWWDAIGDEVSAVRHVWLHPEWSRREDPAVLGAISAWIKTHGDPFRAGWQLHRLYNVDALDTRARPAIPLGGDPARGY